MPRRFTPVFRKSWPQDRRRRPPPTARRHRRQHLQPHGGDRLVGNVGAAAAIAQKLAVAVKAWRAADADPDRRPILGIDPIAKVPERRVVTKGFDMSLPQTGIDFLFGRRDIPAPLPQEKFRGSFDDRFE